MRPFPLVLTLLLLGCPPATPSAPPAPPPPAPPPPAAPATAPTTAPATGPATGPPPVAPPPVASPHEVTGQIIGYAPSDAGDGSLNDFLLWSYPDGVATEMTGGSRSIGHETRVEAAVMREAFAAVQRSGILALPAEPSAERSQYRIACVEGDGAAVQRFCTAEEYLDLVKALGDIVPTLTRRTAR